MSDQPKHPPEWMRERVRRWNEILAANPMKYNPGAGNYAPQRRREFEERCEQLEAEVPTP